jgi:Methyltransferase domain
MGAQKGAPSGLLRNAEPNPRHVVVDPHQATRFANCGLQFLEEAGLASVIEHHAEESQTALPRFLIEGRRFDFAFVDGNHRFDGVFLDLVYLGRRSSPEESWLSTTTNSPRLRGQPHFA